MRLCGISSRFQLLSPCTGQVTHALLTRPPLSHQKLHSEEIRLRCFVRLACVKHAASVHPEPGSNSHIKVFILPESSGWISVPLLLLAKGSHLLFRCIFRCCSLNYSLWIFQGYFTVQLSKFFVRCRSATFISYQMFNRLSTTFLFFICCSLRQLNHIIMYPIVCQQLFSCFLIDSGEGGIWTLAPRERPTPLAGAPLQPLEYFSIFFYKIDAP